LFGLFVWVYGKMEMSMKVRFTLCWLHY